MFTFNFKPRKLLMSLLALLLLILPACGAPAEEPKSLIEVQTVSAEVKLPATKAAEVEAVATVAPLVPPTQTQQAAQAPATLTELEQNPVPATIASAIQAAATEAALVPVVITETLQVPTPQAAVTQAPAAATIAAAIPAAATEAAQVVVANPTSGLIETLRAEGSFSILIRALQVANLIDELEHGPPITLFAPTDEAFNSLSPETLNNLLQNPDILKETLLYHVIVEPMKQDQLTEQTVITHENGTPIDKLPTIQGDTVTIADFDEKLKVNNATIVPPHMQTQNGSLIHRIDIVLQSVAFTASPPPKGLIENIEVWQPYKEGERLPIGDAQLIPGAPEMRTGVRALADVLKSNDVQINTARTVVLEEQGEIAYLAPVASKPDEAKMQELGKIIIGVIVIQGNTSLSTGVGPYALQLQSKGDPNVEDQPQIFLLNAKGQPIQIPGPDGTSSSSIEQVRFIPGVDEGEFPSAALFYGTRYCRSGNYCWPCSWWNLLFYPSYPTSQECRNN